MCFVAHVPFAEEYRIQGSELLREACCKDTGGARCDGVVVQHLWKHGEEFAEQQRPLRVCVKRRMDGGNGAIEDEAPRQTRE